MNDLCNFCCRHIDNWLKIKNSFEKEGYSIEIVKIEISDEFSFENMPYFKITYLKKRQEESIEEIEKKINMLSEQIVKIMIEQIKK